MSNENGAFLLGKNLMLRPLTGGKIVTEGATIDGLASKTNVSALSDGWVGGKTNNVTTTDATVTAIATVSVPVDKVVVIRALLTGKQSDETDATGGTAVGVAINAAGTTALKGTPLYQIVESDAATNITITADNTADTVSVNVTGVAAETWDWGCMYEYIILG